jgi:serine/threonine protein kinase/lipoprotein NlpI
MLENRLDGVELEGIVVHIEICLSCQEQLEDLTRGDAWKSTLRESSGGPSFDPAGLGLSKLFLGNPTIDVPGAREVGEALPLPSGGSTDAATYDHKPADDHETRSRSDSPLEPARTRAREPLPNCPQIPGYDILDHLGEGGMGVVYKARQVGLNRLVALKMIRGGSQVRPEHRARFSIEAEAVARLRHPNILQIYDIGEVDGMPFVSLELLEGGSLAERLDGTPQPGRSSAELLKVLARAIVTAHEAGIIHRDLKPSNVLFATDGVPKVTDFGLAKRMESDSRQTETGVVMGSPSYMAPEQARGHTRDVGPAADIYALGAILYEMLTGRPPFKGETPLETVRQVIFDEIVNPSQLIPRVSRDLETICLKCLNKEPAKRYRSTLELVDDLERFLKGETVLARRTPPIERGIKWARRRPARASALVAAIAAFPILALGFAVFEHNRRIADGERSHRDLALTRDGHRLTDRAKDAKSAGEISKLRDDMSAFLAALTDEDQRRLGFLPAQVKNAFDELKVLEDKQNVERVERQQFQSFLELRAQAQLAAAEFELDPSSRRERLGGAVRKALAVYAQDPNAADEDWVIRSPLSTILSPGDQRRVVDGCFDLLLMLSETTEPRSGLKVLDRAACLRPPSTAAYHLRRARCLAKAGDAAGRDREDSLAAKQPIVTALDHFLIGREHLAKRDWNLAIASLETALRLDPEQISAQLLLGVCNYNSEPRRLREARDNISACLRRHPALVELYLLRARIQGEEGNQMLAQIDPGRAGASASIRKQAEAAFEAALADYQSALERISNDDFRYVLLVNRGGLYLQAGRFPESRADLLAAVRLKPELYQAHSTLGQLHQQQGRIDQAFEAYGHAITLATDPTTLAALHRTRALLYSDRGDASSEKRALALHDLDEAIRLEPENASRRAGDMVERARILFGGARFEEALGACGEALELVPWHLGAHQMRNSTLVAMKRFDEVLSSCDTYLAREKPTVEVLEIRGLARVARKNYSGAVADFTRALDLVSDVDSGSRSRLLNRRGWAYHFADAARLALDDFDASLKLDQNQSDALAGRGLARVRLGDWRDAVADAEAAVRLARRAVETGGDFDDRVQADFNAARIYAQAVEYAAGDVSRLDERAVSLYRGYRARALELLDKALRQVPDAARRKEILNDPALQPLYPAAVRSVSRRTSKRAPQ